MKSLSDSSGLPPLPEPTHSMELLQRFRAGDAVALAELIQRYYPRVHRIARTRMGRGLRDVLESSDLVQNTFRAALPRLGEFEFRHPSALVRYLAKVMENQIREVHDWRDRDQRNYDRNVPLLPSVDEHDSLEPAFEGREPRPFDAISQAELRDIYDSSVHQLEPDHREVILLREYAGAKWSEIAEALDRPNAHAAEQLYQRAQSKLAKQLRVRIRDLTV